MRRQTSGCYWQELSFRRVEWNNNAPPVVVLGAQLEVAQHDGDLRARDRQDHRHQAQEAEQVVELQRKWRTQMANTSIVNSDADADDSSLPALRRCMQTG